MAFTGWKADNLEISPYDLENEGPGLSVEWRSGPGATEAPVETRVALLAVSMLEGVSAEHVYELGFGYIVVGGEVILTTVWSVSLLDSTRAHSRELEDACKDMSAATWEGC